ncbi:MAG: HigA family addiction module antitoxin [bacterium]
MIHPGKILLEEFLKPLGISQNTLSMDIRVPAPRINAIVKETRSISADTATTDRTYKRHLAGGGGSSE